MLIYRILLSFLISLSRPLPVLLGHSIPGTHQPQYSLGCLSPRENRIIAQIESQNTPISDIELDSIRLIDCFSISASSPLALQQEDVTSELFEPISQKL
jgi:hypothetical protein